MVVAAQTQSDGSDDNTGKRWHRHCCKTAMLYVLLHMVMCAACKPLRDTIGTTSAWMPSNWLGMHGIAAGVCMQPEETATPLK